IFHHCFFGRPDEREYTSPNVFEANHFTGIRRKVFPRPRSNCRQDVATQGANFEVVVGGDVEGVSGTSASSPTFASIIALLNDQLITAGKSPLGFLNPFLYSTGATALNDITSGSNPGCNTKGFPAKEGWDPVQVSDRAY
ncbi:peptidase S8/S53 domain-containing protein, partial [Ganoderma leucocontextum]